MVRLSAENAWDTITNVHVVPTPAVLLHTIRNMLNKSISCRQNAPHHSVNGMEALKKSWGTSNSVQMPQSHVRNVVLAYYENSNSNMRIVAHFKKENVSTAEKKDVQKTSSSMNRQNVPGEKLNVQIDAAIWISYMTSWTFMKRNFVPSG